VGEGEGEREDGRRGRGLREGWEMGWEERVCKVKCFSPQFCWSRAAYGKNLVLCAMPFNTGGNEAECMQFSVK
jgi:hypothetical protein